MLALLVFGSHGLSALGFQGLEQRRGAPVELRPPPSLRSQLLHTFDQFGQLALAPQQLRPSTPHVGVELLQAVRQHQVRGDLSAECATMLREHVAQAARLHACRVCRAVDGAERGDGGQSAH